MPFMVNRQGEAWYIPDVPDPMEPSSGEPDGPESETDEKKDEHPGGVYTGSEAVRGSQVTIGFFCIRTVL